MKIRFSELFDGLNSGNLGYAARCASLSGKEVEIRGWLSPAHDGSGQVLLVNEPGACPDCSPLPVAALLLPGFALSGKLKNEAAVTLGGRVSFGFVRDEQDRASFLRLENAKLSLGLAR